MKVVPGEAIKTIEAIIAALDKKLTEQINQIISAVNKLGLAVRGLYGEGTESLGIVFQVSNQMTLGETENDIAHSEADRRQRDCAIAQLMNEVVVAAATRNRTEFSCPIKGLEDNAGIISEPAHDRKINFAEFCQAASPKVAHQLIELIAPSASI